MQKQIRIATLILTGLTSAVAVGHTGATGIVKERMEYFKASKDNLKKIRAHINNENYAAIVPLASDIASWADKIPDYFPAESNIKPSEASSEVWSNPKGFKAAAQLNWKAAVSLAKAAKGSDQNAVISAFKKTAASCKSCHKTYRLK